MDRPVRHRSVALAAAALFALGSAAAAKPPVFNEPVQVSTGIDVIRAFVGDFDGDGVPDLAAADRTTHVIKVRRGTGDGTTFLSPTTGFSASSGPDDIAVGKMDGDAFLDFVTVEGGALVPALCHGFDPLNLSALKYERGTPLTFTGVTFDHVAAGDVNGDGIADIVGAGSHPSLDTYVVVFLNDGNGGFDGGTSHSVSVESGILALGDLTRDGLADVVLCTESQNALSIFRNLGAGGSLADASVRFLGHKPTAVVLTDITTDGVPDIVVAGYGRDLGTHNVVSMEYVRNTAQPNSQSISLNPGSSFQINSVAGDPAPYRAGVAVADFDGDGEVDFAISDPIGSRVSILQIHPFLQGGEFVGFDFPDPLTNIPVAGSVQGVVAGEMESTGGKVDLVTWHGGSNGVYSHLNRTTGGGGGGGLEPAENLAFASKKVKKKYNAAQPFTFFAKITDASAPGFAARVQSTFTPDSDPSWTDLPGAYLEHRGSGTFGEGWYTQTNVPDGVLYFRVVISATGRIDAVNTETSGPARYLGPVTVLPTPALLSAPVALENASTGSQAVVKIGENVKVTVRVANTGGTSAPGQYVGASVPEGCTFVSSSPASTRVGNLVVWGPVEVLGKSSTDYTFLASVDAATQPGAKLKSSGGVVRSLKRLVLGDSNELTVQSSIEVRPTADRSSARPGDLLTFTMGLHNFGASALNDPVITCAPPAGTSLVEAKYLDGSGGVMQGFEPEVSAARDLVTWVYGPFQANDGYAQIRMTVRVVYDHDVTSPVVLDGYSFRGNPASGGAPISAAVVPFSVPMSGEGPATSPRPSLDGYLVSGREDVQHPVHGLISTCLAEDELLVLIAVRNPGDADLVRPTLHASLPTGTAYVPGSFTIDSIAEPDPSFDGSVFEKRLPDIGPNSGFLVGYRARVRAPEEENAFPAGSIIGNFPCVLTSESMRYWTTGASVRALILRPVELEVRTVAGMPAGMKLGETATIRFRVTNRGQVAGAAALASITVPTGVEVTDLTIDGSFASSITKGSVVAVTLGTIQPGQSVEVAVEFQWKTLGPANQALAFSFAASSGVANSKVTKTLSSVGGAVIAKDDPNVPRLAVTVVSPLFAFRGSQYDYTLVVANLGDAAADGVALYSALPAGVGVEAAGLSDGGKLKKKGSVQYAAWSLGTIAPHSVRAVTMRAAVPSEGFTSCSTAVFAQVFAKNAASKCTGVVPTNVRSPTVFQFVEGLQCLIQGIALAYGGLGNEALQNALNGMTGDSLSANVAGADFSEFKNGSFVIELGGGQVLACGRTGTVTGGTEVGSTTEPYTVRVGTHAAIRLTGLACYGDTVTVTEALTRINEALVCKEVNISLNGGLNTATGNQLTPSAGSLLPGTALTPRIDLNATVTSSAGLVAAGAGNVLSHNGGVLVAAGAGNAKPGTTTNMVAAGAGNMVAAGAGNMVAAGAGNMVAAGAGNLVGNNGNSVLPSGAGR